MPHPTLWAATVLAAGLLAACSGPMKTSVPYGMVYECDRGGVAEIRYNRGGFIPDQSVNFVDREGQTGRAPRSSADLRYDNQTYHLIAEWTEQGLRYRSENPVEGRGYLIWTQRAEDPDHRQAWTRPAGPRGGEDAKIGWRADLVAAPPPAPYDDGYAGDPGEGNDHAVCVRSGRVPRQASHGSDGDAEPRAPAEPHHR